MRSNSPGKRVVVTIMPGNRVIEALAGQTLAEALSGAAWLDLPCGGMGTCGRCVVKAEGEMEPPDSVEAGRLGPEALNAGYRLACQAVIAGDVTVTPGRETVGGQDKAASSMTALSLLEGSPVLIREARRPYRYGPSVMRLWFDVDLPSLETQKDDLSRVVEAISTASGGPPDEVEPGATGLPVAGGPSNGMWPVFSLEAIRDLPRSLPRGLPGQERDDSAPVWAVVAGRYPGWRVVSVGRDRPPAGGPFGVALDCGTTTLAAYLVDLAGWGRAPAVVAGVSGTNPQVSCGADVISRIAYSSRSDDGVREMSALALKGFNGLIGRLCAGAGIGRRDVTCATIVGNTCMASFLLGADPRYLGTAPYVPPFKGPLTVSAAEAGLDINPAAEVWVAPGIAGYVGGDTVAVAAVTTALDPSGTWLAVDIGTNGEVILNSGGRLLACSTAAGPAFEGGQIACGMRAGPGAITDVRIDDREAPKISVSVSGGGKPVGLCGSGLIRATSELLLAGLLAPSGRLSKAAFPAGEAVLGFDPAGIPVRLTQRDIREFQLAKAALRTGIDVLMEQAGLGPEDLDAIYLAGAFGNHIRPDDAIGLGLLPPVDVSKVVPVGNAAGTGAQLFLLSSEAREQACLISSSARHVELSITKSFQERFLSNVDFPGESPKGGHR